MFVKNKADTTYVFDEEMKIAFVCSSLQDYLPIIKRYSEIQNFLFNCVKKFHLSGYLKKKIWW